jgi:hypothetical protein
MDGRRKEKGREEWESGRQSVHGSFLFVSLYLSVLQQNRKQNIIVVWKRQV